MPSGCWNAPECPNAAVHAAPAAFRAPAGCCHRSHSASIDKLQHQTYPIALGLLDPGCMSLLAPVRAIVSRAGLAAPLTRSRAACVAAPRAARPFSTGLTRRRSSYAHKPRGLIVRMVLTESQELGLGTKAPEFEVRRVAHCASQPCATACATARRPRSSAPDRAVNPLAMLHCYRLPPRSCWSR